MRMSVIILIMVTSGDGVSLVSNKFEELKRPNGIDWGRFEYHPIA